MTEEKTKDQLRDESMINTYLTPETHNITVELLIMDPPKSGHPLYNG